MNKYYFLLLAISLLLASCHKSDNAGPGNTGYRMLTWSDYQNGQTEPFNVTHFHYDDAGNLFQTMTINYGDTFMGRQHVYVGNVLQYAFYPPVWDMWDTIFYFFGPGNRLDSIVEHDDDFAGLSIKTTNYFYNGSNQVVHSLGHVKSGGTTQLADSMFYSYTGNNITGIRWYDKHGSNPWDSTILELTYDNGRNYYKTMGLPLITFHYWSENNIVQIRDVGMSAIVLWEHFTEYNGDGYPTAFRDSIGVVPHEVRIAYDR